MTIEDPLSGAPLTLIPTKSIEAGLECKARFPIAQFLPCSNGCALIHGHPALNITQKEGHFIVAASEGETHFFSTERDRALGEKSRPLPTLLHLEKFNKYWNFPLSSNKMDEAEFSWYEQLRSLERELSLINNPKEESKKRLDLARFFIGSLHALEAREQLSLSLSQSPTLAHNPEFLALQALSALLTQDYGQADEALSSLLREHEELMPWHAILLLEQKKTNAAYVIFEKSLQTIMAMPPPLKKYVLFKAMKTALLAKKSVLPFSDSLKGMTLSLLEESQITLYQAHNLSQSEDNRDKAVEIYKNLFRTAPPPVNIEALLKWISSSDVDPEEALEQIDRVRFLWEENPLSFALHALRASLFEQKKKWFEALNSLEDALSYADLDQAKPLREKAQKIFMDQFVHSQSLSPLKTLAFYERFRKFAPYHDIEKRYILNGRLMEILVDLDLLDQAFLIGRQNIKKFKDPQDKNAISLYLAFLLIESEKSEKALEKLKEIESQTLDDKMQLQAQHLKCTCLSETGKICGNDFFPRRAGRIGI